MNKTANTCRPHMARKECMAIKERVQVSHALLTKHVGHVGEVGHKVTCWTRFSTLKKHFL